MKKLLLSTCILVAFTNSYATDFVGAAADVLKAKIEADRDVAMGKKQIVKVENSTISGTSIMGKDNVVVGNNGGVVAIGEEVEISNSTISGTAIMGDNNVVIGNNGGVVLGAH